MELRYLLLLTTTICMTALQPARAQLIQSPAMRVSLLELYTSEGCSSCPPAESWLSGLTDDPRLWRQVVPVAFHVDYWDELGWHDPFDAHAYTERQRRLVIHDGGSVVYTPEFLLNASEWHNFFDHRPLSLDTGTKVGVLSVETDDGKVEAAFTPTVPTSSTLILHVAVLAFGVVTKVGAGENAGRALEHDFLVIGYNHTTLQPTAAGFTATMHLPQTVSVKAKRYALAAWVSQADDPQPLQAAGGWLGH
ncbi:MAG: DUF1223 domain-containing protein [Gammaproteobacteria bacterium]